MENKMCAELNDLLASIFTDDLKPNALRKKKDKEHSKK